MFKNLPKLKSGVFDGVMWKLYSKGKTAINNVIALMVINLVKTVEHHWRVLASANSKKIK